MTFSEISESLRKFGDRRLKADRAILHEISGAVSSVSVGGTISLSNQDPILPERDAVNNTVDLEMTG
jgi:hypothetical protein